MLKKNLLIISVLALLIAPTIAYAIDVPGLPIVQCGLSKDNPATTDINEKNSCTRCDLFKLLNNIINFITGGLMPPVAILLFVWAGFLILLGGANTNLVAQGRQIFTTTFFGIMIMLAAWMITNTLIQSVGAKYNNAQNWWQFTCVETVPVSPPVVFGITTTSLPGATVGQPYNQTIQVTGGVRPFAWTQLGSLPVGLSFNTATGVISGTPTATGTSNFTVKVTDNSTPQKSATKQLSIVVGGTTTGDACSNQQTLAQQHTTTYPRKRSPELEQLFSCIAGKLGQAMPQEAGSNSFYGSLYTYDQSSVLCNYTRGDKHCDSSCSHATNSCHYGGKTGAEGSLAADFGNEAKGDIIIQAALACGAKSGRCENAAGVNVDCAPGSGANHIHISSKSCDAN